MDVSLLSKASAEAEASSTSRPSSNRRDYTAGFLNTRLPWRSSTAHLVTNDAIIPIITTTRRSTSSIATIIANLNTQRLIRRSHSAPSVFTEAREEFNSLEQRPRPKATPLIVRQAFIGLVVYIVVGVAIYLFQSNNFSGTTTFKPVDALYFSVVTLCTIGYGDIVPDTTVTKLYACVFILIGFGFVGILLNGLVTYILDKQEMVLLSAVDENTLYSTIRTYMIDAQKGRMRIRIKVALALAVVILCIAIGTVAAHFLEGLTWVDSIYLSVISVTTVGYGDYSFSTLKGRCFAIVWLLVSTLAVARAFLYLTELRIDKRNNGVANWILQKKMTLSDLVAADLDKDGSISKSEYVIYKLKEMGKIEEKDIMQICNQFDTLEHSSFGKLTFTDLMGAG
uniref:Potassium channel domain-containing protein n=1 Tax=Kalanchoe fedtschenkoi TaxID=63787 RepID=A0A7N0TJQ4_KALFE